VVGGQLDTRPNKQGGSCERADVVKDVRRDADENTPRWRGSPRRDGSMRAVPSPECSAASAIAGVDVLLGALANLLVQRVALVLELVHAHLLALVGTFRANGCAERPLE
jgi:hypothetical protein